MQNGGGALALPPFAYWPMLDFSIGRHGAFH
jgi:hypothetical protein